MKRYILSIFMLLCISWTYLKAQELEDNILKPVITFNELENIQLPDVNIDSVKLIEENNCIIVHGTIGSEIGFEVILPDEWNLRFVMSGGGGFVSTVTNSFRYLGNQGYVTAGTNTGHEGTWGTADWALNNMERQLNYGHLAIHRTAVVAKAIMNEYYGKFPLYSYFAGCSRGGGQALIEAQRYPDDFNGIIAGAPVLDFPGSLARFIINSQLMYPDPSNLEAGVMSRDHLKVLQEFIIDQCDDKDGVQDNILNDPDDCYPDLSLLNNYSGEDEELSLSDMQIDIIRKIYKEVSIEGKVIYPRYPWGSEQNWWGWVVGPHPDVQRLGFPTSQFAFGTEGAKYLIFNNPDFDYSKYNFENFKKETEYAGAYLNATSSDYSKFRDKGGKLIIYHGWNDAAFSAYSTIEHFEAIKHSDSSADDYIKLYLLPGVNHCGGGPGPSTTDWLKPIRDWVEKGVSPEKIIVSKYKDNELVMSRPVYPYPAKAIYKGTGDPNIESSFMEKK